MDQTMVSNQTIWEAIQQLKSDMLSHFEMVHIQVSLNTMQRSPSTLREQVSELKHRVSGSEESITDLEKEKSYLKEKSEDAENQKSVL